MRAIRRSWFVDGLLGVLSIGVVGGGLLLMDQRVQNEISRIVNDGRPSGQMVAVGHQVQDLAFHLVNLAYDQSIAHAPLAVFAVVALLLFIVMTRV